MVDDFAADILFSGNCWKSNRYGRQAQMGRLEEAKEKLDRALARLEQVAQRPMREAVSESNSGVEAALAASRAKCATLEAQSGEISDRLDAAIERLQSVLKEDENGSG